VDSAFAVGVFSSPTPDATRVGELYKGQVVVGVAEWHTRVGRGPLGLNFGCSEEDTWLRLSAQDLPLAWADGTPSELWVHTEHRRAGCCDVQLQVYLIEAPQKPPPPLPERLPERSLEPEPEPEPEPGLPPPRLPATAQAGVDEDEEAEALAGGIDRSSLDVLRVSASSMDAMRLSNSSRCSFEDEAVEAEAEAEAVAAAVAKGAQKRSKSMGKRQKEIEKEVEKELKLQGIVEDAGDSGSSAATIEELRRELQSRGEPADGDIGELYSRLKGALVASRLADSWLTIVSSSDAEAPESTEGEARP
jgi:hypothetical protein